MEGQNSDKSSNQLMYYSSSGISHFLYIVRWLSVHLFSSCRWFSRRHLYFGAEETRSGAPSCSLREYRRCPTAWMWNERRLILLNINRVDSNESPVFHRLSTCFMRWPSCVMFTLCRHWKKYQRYEVKMWVKIKRHTWSVVLELENNLMFLRVYKLIVDVLFVFCRC